MNPSKRSGPGEEEEDGDSSMTAREAARYREVGRRWPLSEALVNSGVPGVWVMGYREEVQQPRGNDGWCGAAGRQSSTRRAAVVAVLDMHRKAQLRHEVLSDYLVANTRGEMNLMDCVTAADCMPAVRACWGVGTWGSGSGSERSRIYTFSAKFWLMVVG
jgi:hypothetical protein